VGIPLGEGRRGPLASVKCVLLFVNWEKDLGGGESFRGGGERKKVCGKGEMMMDRSAQSLGTFPLHRDVRWISFRQPEFGRKRCRRTNGHEGAAHLWTSRAADRIRAGRERRGLPARSRRGNGYSFT